MTDSDARKKTGNGIEARRAGSIYKLFDLLAQSLDLALNDKNKKKVAESYGTAVSEAGDGFVLEALIQSMGDGFNRILFDSVLDRMPDENFENFL